MLFSVIELSLCNQLVDPRYGFLNVNFLEGASKRDNKRLTAPALDEEMATLGGPQRKPKGLEQGLKILEADILGVLLDLPLQIPVGRSHRLQGPYVSNIVPYIVLFVNGFVLHFGYDIAKLCTLSAEYEHW